MDLGADRPTQLSDIRMVCVDGSHAFHPHREVGHYKSSPTSMALHLNVWVSYGCAPGNTDDGPWNKLAPTNDVFLNEGIVDSRFGECECSCDKAEHEFLFRSDMDNRRKEGRMNLRRNQRHLLRI